MVKYIIRVLKYFVYICVLLAAILAIMIALKLVSSDINVLFKDGYNSLWKIAAMFFAVSCIYPKFGYTKRGAIVPGEYSEIKDGVVDFMASKGYVLEKEEDENLTFRARSFVYRLARVFEDRITFTRELPGFYVEGRTKDVMRLVSGLEYRFRNPDED